MADVLLSRSLRVLRARCRVREGVRAHHRTRHEAERIETDASTTESRPQHERHRESVIGLVLSVLAIAYLVYALVFPEKL